MKVINLYGTSVAKFQQMGHLGDAGAEGIILFLLSVRMMGGHLNWVVIIRHIRGLVNKVMRLIQYNSVLTFKLQIEFVPFKIVSLGRLHTSRDVVPTLRSNGGSR